MHLVFNKVRQGYTTVAIILLNLIVLIIIIELLSFPALYVYRYFQRYEYHPATNLVYYQQQEWGVDYWKEQSLYQSQIYSHYVGWRGEPYNGNLINVDESGLRVTPTSEETNPSLSIFCFGGSTMWGYGAPDWGTIPAYLAENLNTRFQEESITVVNFGERSDFSSQEVIRLIQEIKHSNIPDIAIFYDGVNDVGWAYKNRQADIPYDMWDTFGAKSRETRYRSLTSFFLNLNSVSQIRDFMSTHIEPKPYLGGEVDKLAYDVVSVYLQNIDIVNALSKQYGFDCYFFWQPSLYEESKPLVLEEQEIRRSIVPASGFESIDFRHTIYNLIKSEAGTRDNLYYIANIFNDSQDFLFFDGAHIVPVGNKLVAEKMADIIASGITR